MLSFTKKEKKGMTRKKLVKKQKINFSWIFGFSIFRFGKTNFFLVIPKKIGRPKKSDTKPCLGTASDTYISTFGILTVNIECMYGTYFMVFILLMEKKYERGGIF